MPSASKQGDDLVAGQPVIHELRLLPPDDQPDLLELLQVLGGVGDAGPGQGGELVDAALALRKQLEQLQPTALDSAVPMRARFSKMARFGLTGFDKGGSPGLVFK